MTEQSLESNNLTLIARSQGNPDQEALLDHGLTIGSDSACTICIDDSGVESIHAEVLRQADGSVSLICPSSSARIRLPDGATCQSLSLIAGTRFQIGSVSFYCQKHQSREATDESSLWKTRCPKCRELLEHDGSAKSTVCPACEEKLYYFRFQSDDATQGADGQAASRTFEGWVPKLVGPYRIRGMAGQGSLGIVLWGANTQNDRVAAVKLIYHEIDPDRFQTAVEPLRKLAHPNIVPLQDFGQEGKLLWIAVDWEEGKTLRKVIQETGSELMSIVQVRLIIGQVLEGLNYLHTQGVVHRSLKPGNILIGADGTARLADFGLTNLFSSVAGMAAPNQSGMTSNDIGYIAPEQLSGGQATAANDIFSLGMVWYEMLTGHQAQGVVTSVSFARQGMPPAWGELIARCLSRHPASRPGLSDIAKVFGIESTESTIEPITMPENDTGYSVLHVTTNSAVPSSLAKRVAGNAKKRGLKKSHVKSIVVGVFVVAIAGALFWKFRPPEPSSKDMAQWRQLVVMNPAKADAYLQDKAPVRIEQWKNDAEAGDQDGEFLYGKSFENGWAVAISGSQAAQWYHKAAIAGSLPAALRLGLMYQNGLSVPRDDAQAFTWLKKAAEAGNIIGMVHLGQLYQAGQGVAANPAQAIDWYRKAAEAGNTDGMISLALMYQNGQGIGQDDAKAFSWSLKAAEAGNAKAMSNLGWLYQNGRGTAKNNQQAIDWHRKAAEAGVVDSMLNLGIMYAKGQGVPQNDAQAVDWYRKAAQANNKTAMLNLGIMYAQGRGVKQDDVQAVSWYRLTAETGDVQGMIYLASMYATGRGVPKDGDQAIDWYRKAAQAGSAEGMLQLGILYKEGKIVSQNQDLALSWLHKAADAGSAEAMLNLGIMYAEELGFLKDDAQAVEWYRKAAYAGNKDAMNRLAKMYQEGRGVPKDSEQANFWLQKAQASDSTN